MRCIICKSTRSTSPDSTFHRFPKDENITSMWLNAIGISSVNKRRDAICSNHFSKASYTDFNLIRHSCMSTNIDVYPSRRKLRADAVPLLALDVKTLSNITNITHESNMQNQNYMHKQNAYSTDNSENDSCDIQNCPPALDEKYFYRTQLPTDVSQIPSTTTFCFYDGYQQNQIKRADFVSDEAWTHFLKLMDFKDQIICYYKNRNRLGP